MQSHCYIEELDCRFVLKSVANSDVIGVWWVNPAQAGQILHLGQYHLLQDAWYDVMRRSGELYPSDAAWLRHRPAIALNAKQLSVLRRFAQQRFTNDQLTQAAA